MKILLKTAFASLATVFAISACAMDVTGYRSFIQKSKSGNSESQYVRGVLLGYHQGLAEAFIQVRDANKGVINFNGTSFICVPASVEITPKLVEAAIDAALKNKINRESLGDNWEKVMVGTFAYMGLWQLYPCKKAQ